MSDFGKPISATKFGLVMSSVRPTDRRPYVRTLLHVSQCEMRHSKKCGSARFFTAGSCIANCVLEKKIIILTEYKVNFCDQQREKDRYD